MNLKSNILDILSIILKSCAIKYKNEKLRKKIVNLISLNIKSGAIKIEELVNLNMLHV